MPRITTETPTERRRTNLHKLAITMATRGWSRDAMIATLDNRKSDFVVSPELRASTLAVFDAAKANQ